MRVIFMGTAALACPSLRRLAATGRDRIVAVVTRPDRPRGRHLRCAATPVRRVADELGLRVWTPGKVSTPESVKTLGELAPDVVVVVAYGQILKPAVLEVPALGCINMHASLLPAYRGAAPIQWAVACGEHETGVTVMAMDEGMDTGDILLQRRVPINEDDTAGSVHDRLAVEGSDLLAEAMDRLRRGELERRPQDHGKASMAPKLTKADGQVDWSLPARDIRNRVRGFHPWPCCWTTVRDRDGVTVTLRLHEVRAEPGEGTPGLVLDVGPDGPLVAAGQGAVRLRRVQPAGGRVMSGADYLHGHGMTPGDTVGAD